MNMVLIGEFRFRLLLIISICWFLPKGALRAQHDCGQFLLEIDNKINKGASSDSVFHRLQNIGCAIPNRILADVLKNYCLEEKSEYCRELAIDLLRNGYISPFATFPVSRSRFELIDSLSLLYEIDLDSILEKTYTQFLSQVDDTFYLLKEVASYDQRIRQSCKYKESRSYGFNSQLGLPLPNVDRSQHLVHVAKYKEWRSMDSVNLRKLVDIIVAKRTLPYVASNYGAIDLSVLICHMAYYRWEEDLSKILLEETLTSRLCPGVYAWFIGYHNEYFDKEKIYYFTNNESDFDQLSSEEIRRINRDRSKIFLNPVPSTIWNTRIW